MGSASSFGVKILDEVAQKDKKKKKDFRLQMLKFGIGLSII